jgi:hypothetical protein
MRGHASATSLLRLVLCAGFLCVTWILLSPGEAQAAERARPEVTALLVTPADAATQARVHDMTAPVRHATRRLAAVAPAAEAVRPVERELQSVREAVSAVAGDVDTVVREPVEAATETVRTVGGAVLGVSAAVVQDPALPELPAVPAVPGAPSVAGPSATDPPVSGVPAEADRRQPRSSGRTTGHGAVIAFAAGAPDQRSGFPVVTAAILPVRDGGVGTAGGMPLATSPSGSAAGSAGGHGAAADGVLPCSRLDVPALISFSMPGDHTASCGSADRPGSRPD